MGDLSSKYNLGGSGALPLVVVKMHEWEIHVHFDHVCTVCIWSCYVISFTNLFHCPRHVSEFQDSMLHSLSAVICLFSKPGV